MILRDYIIMRAKKIRWEIYMIGKSKMNLEQSVTTLSVNVSKCQQLTLIVCE